MRQVLMQRGNHTFIRYCASESVFAGVRRIAKLATSIAIAAAFTGIALPTSSAQAQSATFAVGDTTFAENETSSVTLTLDNLPTDQDISSAEVELIFTGAEFGTPSGTTYTGTSFAVTVTGDNNRTITPMPVAQPTRIRVAAAISPSPGDTTAAITWTIQPADISSSVTFTARRPGGKHIIFKDSNGNPVTVAGLRQPALRQAFTITTVLAEDAVFVTYTYQNGDTIPGVKREEPMNTDVIGVDWDTRVGINLLAGQTARYSDGTAYECDSSSSSNCLIRIPGGQIANGGPVNATFPEESAPPAPTIPTPPPPVAEPGPELEIGKQVIPGTETAVVFNDTGVPGFPGEEGSRSRSIAETSAIVQAFDQSFGLLGAPSFNTAKCTYGLGGDAYYGEDYYVVDSSDADILHPDDPLLVGTPTLRVVPNGPVDPNDPNDAGNPATDDSDLYLLIDERCTPASPVTWSIRLIGDNVVQGNKRIVFALREVQLFAGGTAPENALGVLAITQRDTLVLTVVDDEVNDVGQVVVNEITGGGAGTAEGSTASHRIGLDRGNDGIVFMAYAITGINEEGNVVTDASTGISAADITAVTAMNAAIGSAVAATRDGVVAHDVSDDIRRGVIAIVANPAGAQSLEGILNINFAADSTPEGDETYALTLSSLDNSVIFVNSLRPGLRPGTNEQEVAEPGVGRIQATITDGDTAPLLGLAAAIPGDDEVPERAAPGTGTSTERNRFLNNVFTLSAGAATTMGYRLTGPGAGDITIEQGSDTIVSPNADDSRIGMIEVTSGTQGRLNLIAAADNILEEREAFTLTLLAGDPSNTNLALVNGRKNYYIKDATPDVTPTLTWPVGVDGIPTPGHSEFPFGGVLEGATPHLLVDLGGTTVARDTVIPISVGRGFRLDARVEPLYFDEDGDPVRAAIIPAGSSRGTARVRIVADHISEGAEIVTFTLEEPISGITEAEGIITNPGETDSPIQATITINDRPDVEADAVTWRSITGQVNPGAGETHVADLTIRVDGGFTSDREAVDIYFDAESALGDVSWKRAGSENVLPIITRNHIAVSRFSFSPASASDSTPVVTIGLYFTPIALIPTGQRVVVDLTRVDLINRSAGEGLAPIRARLCNDSDSVAAEACANHGFNAGEPRFVIAEEADASEVGPVNGGFKLTIAEAFRTPANGALTPTGTINYSVSGSARRGITRDYTLDITATNAAGDTNTTAAITTDTFGEVSIPFDNLDNIISFTVIPVADADGDEGTETVEITIDNIAFTGPDPVDIPGPQTLEINIADAPVATMGFVSTYNLFRLDTVEGATSRRGVNLEPGDDGRTHNIASVRLRVTDIPTDAFYADISYQVDPASTATDRSQAGGGATEDYTIARANFVSGSSPDGTTGLGTSNTVTIDRDPTGNEQELSGSGINNLDYWINVIDDSIVEPPETVIMNFTATFFPCLPNSANTATTCVGGRGSQQIGPEIPFSFTFLINDNEAASAVRNRRLSPAGVVNEGGRVQAVFGGNERAEIAGGQTFFYNITDASGGVITEDNLGVTAADFRVTTNPRVGACGTPTAEQMAAGIICRGVYTAIGSASSQIDLEIVDDELGENDEAFYVNLEPAMLTRGNTGNFPGNPVNVEIAAGTRILVTIADSDGGGPPPPVPGARARLATTGTSEILNDSGDTTLTLQISDVVVPEGETIARAKATLSFSDTDGNALTPGFSDAVGNLVSGLNYDVTVATTATGLATSRAVDNIVAEFNFTGGDALLTYTIAANDVDDANLSYDFSVNIESVEFLDSTPAEVTLDPALTVLGGSQNLSIVAPPEAETVSVVATTTPAVEGSALGLVTFTLSEVPTADTTITFTATSTDTGVRGNCRLDSSTGFCIDAFIPASTITHVLATRTGTSPNFTYALLPAVLNGSTVVPAGPTTITIPANTSPPTYEMFVVPVSELGELDPDETAIITVTDVTSPYTIAGSAATVTIVDPGSLTLDTGFSNVDDFAPGGSKEFKANLMHVATTSSNGTDVHQVVIDLAFPTSDAFTETATGVMDSDQYLVEFGSNISVNAAATVSPVVGDENILRVVVPRTSLADTGSGGLDLGAEFTDVTVTAKTGAIGVSADPLIVDSAHTEDSSGNTLDSLSLFRSGSGGNQFNVVAAPVVTLASTLTDNSEIAGTQGDILRNPEMPNTAADPNALQINITNPFARALTGIRVTHTLRIAPTAGTTTAPLNGEITIIPDSVNQNTIDGTLQGAVVTFTTPSDDANAREFNVTHVTNQNFDANGGTNDDFTLNISLGATVFGGDDKRYTISLVRAQMEDVDAGIILAAGPPTTAQSEDVVVPATEEATATLRLTGPSEIAEAGSLVGQETTTYEVVLQNITPDPDDTVMIVAVEFVSINANFLTRETPHTVGGDFLGFIDTIGTVNSGKTSYFMLDDNAFTTGTATIRGSIHHPTNDSPINATFTPRVMSANFYTEPDSTGTNAERASRLTTLITTGPLPTADTDTSVATENIFPSADSTENTITVVAAGTLRVVTLSPAGLQNIANNNGPGADYTVSLTNIFNDINSTAVDSALMTLSAVGDFAAVGVDPKTIVLGTGETAFLLTLMPSALEGLEFSKPGSIAANQVQVSIPDDTAEFVIAVSATGTGAATESLEVTNVAYFDSSSTDLNGPRPHVIGDIQFASVDDPVVVALSSARRTIIGTGGGAQGMTEFFLTLTDLNDDDVVTVPLTLGNIGTISSTTATTVDGSNYDVVITGTSGVGSPDDAEFMTTGAASTVTFTADGDGDARIDFQITSEGNAAEPTISLGAISIGTRNIVTQTTSLAYQIVSATTVPSISVSNTAAFEIDFATDTLTVNEGDAADAKTFQIKPSHLTAYIEMLNPGVDVATGHIDVTLRATDLTFNQANGRTITLGDAAATLTIASTLDHEFVNDTAGSSTAILRISGVQTSTITFTGGFVDSDVDFTLAPTAVAYFDSSGDPLDGPAPRFTGGRFSVEAVKASAQIEEETLTVIKGTDGEFTVTLEGYALANSSGTNIDSVRLEILFENDSNEVVEFNSYLEGTRTYGSASSLNVTFSDNIPGTPVTVARIPALDGIILLNIPRDRFLPSGEEASGYEQVTFTVDASGAPVDGYTVEVTQASSYIGGTVVQAPDPAPTPLDSLALTVRDQGTATLNAFAVSGAPDGVDTTANEEGTIAGGWVLRLRNVAVPTENVVVNYTIPALAVVDDIPDAIPGTDYTLSADDIVSGDPGDGTVEITQPEVDPDTGIYTGTLTIGADAYVDGDSDGITGPRIDIFVTPVDDDIVEGVEDVRLRISEVPGATYTASDPVIQNVRIADNDTATVAIGVNNELVDQGDDPVAGVREGFTYPVQLFIKEGNYTSGLDTELLSETNNILLAEDATFTLEFAAGTTGSADITGDNSDVFFSDSTGGTPSETATVTIPAGESTGLAYITIRSESAVDGVERFKIDITESDTVPFQPVYAGRSAALRADVTIRNTSGDIRIRHEADAGFCAGRTPAVRNVIIPLLSIAGVTDCATAATSETADATAFDAALAAITTLDLSGVSPDLTSLQPGDFAGLTRLTTLGLNSNNIRVLPATVFDPLVALTSLTLAGNELTNSYDSIPENVFDNLAVLSTLNMGNMSTLTGLPDNVLDDVLNTLTTLTLDDAAQRFVTFAEPNEYEVTQSGETTVRLRITNSAGETATTPTAMFVTLNTTGGTGLNPPDTLPDLNSVDRDGIIIPAGSSGVDVVITADDNAVNTVAGTPATLGFINVTSQTFLGTYNDPTFTPSLLQSDMLISVTANSATPAPDPVTASVDIVAPVVMEATDDTAEELNNDPGVIDMTLNRIATDVGTADVTFTLTGGDGLGTDYRLAITRPDGDGTTAVNDTSGSELVLADAATGGTFRLPADVSAATFTLTPIADGFPSSEGTETVTIAITEVDYSDGTLHTAFTIAAAIDITDNTTAPTVAVTPSSQNTSNDGINGAGTQITENDGDDQHGTFTISLADAPEGVATVTYTLEVSDETDPAEDFDAIDQIRTDGLGGEVPTTVRAGESGTFTMTVADGETTASGDLSFTAARDDDRDNENVFLTVSGVTFADIGTGTDITAPASAIISIIDDAPLDSLQVVTTDATAVDGFTAQTGEFTLLGIAIPDGTEITFTLASPNATFGTDYTLSVPGPHTLRGVTASGGIIVVSGEVDAETGIPVTLTPGGTADTDTTNDDVTLTVTAATNSLRLATAPGNAATITIREAGMIAMSANDRAAAELNSATGTFQINLTGIIDNTQNVNIPFVYADAGTATDPATATATGAEDYNITVATPGFANGASITSPSATGGTIELLATAIQDATNGGATDAAQVVLTITPVAGDRRIEDDETVILSLPGDTIPAGFGYTEDPVVANRTVTIVDEAVELLEYGFVTLDVTGVSEPTTGSQDLTYVLTVNPIAGGSVFLESNVEFNARTENNTAVAPGDYTHVDEDFPLEGSVGTPLEIAGEITRNMVIPIHSDTAVEGPEVIRVILSATDAAIGWAENTNEGSGTVSIDDSEENVITITVADSTTLTEATDDTDGIALTFTLDDTFTLERDLDVDLDISPDSPTGDASAAGIAFDAEFADGDDYKDIGTAELTVGSSNGTLADPGGSFTTALIAVPINDDNRVEGPETFSIDITEVTGNTAINDFASVDGTIVDNDEAIARVVTTRSIVREGDTNFQAWVTLDKPLDVDATFTLDLRLMGTPGNTAVAADVQLPGTPTVSIEAGETSSLEHTTATSQRITLTVPDNGSSGGIFQVGIGSVAPDFRGTEIENRIRPLTPSLPVTIAAPAEPNSMLLSRVGDGTATEVGTVAGTYTINLEQIGGTVTGDVDIPYTLVPNSTAALTATGTAANGTAAATDDFTITVDTPGFTGGASILATPAPTATSGTIRVTAGAIANATNGGNGTAAEITVSITPADDNRVELAQTVILSLGTPDDITYSEVAAAASRTITITDHPDLISVSVGTPIEESDGATAMLPVTFTTTTMGTVLERAISLELDTGDRGTIQAVAGTDYTAVVDGAVMLASGTDFDAAGEVNPDTDTTEIVMVAIALVDDALVEGDETFGVTISEPTSDPAVADHFEQEIFITDNDGMATVTVHAGNVSTGVDATSVFEGATDFRAWVTLDPLLDVDATFTLNLRLSGVGALTAVAADVMLATATVSVEAGEGSSLNHRTETSQSILLTIPDTASTDKTFQVGIASANLGDRQTSLVTITDTSNTITITEPPNICNRTDEVEEAIRAEIQRIRAGGTIACADVMNDDEHLDDITSLSVTLGGTLPVSGDFAGLSDLRTLNLINGTFSGGTLSADIFTGLDASLTTLNLSRASGTGGSGLTGISDAAFDSLTGLMTLNLEGNTIAGVTDATIFTPLTALTTLNLGGNTTLVLEPGALDVVLDGLTALTWPTQRTVSFASSTASVGQGQTASISVELNAPLPVAVQVTITESLSGIDIATADIPAGSSGPVDAVITAAANATRTTGTLSIGTPVLLLGGATPGDAISNVNDANVRTALVVADPATADLEVTAPTGPAVSLTANTTTSIRTGRDVTFSVGLRNFTAANLPGFSAVSFKLNLEGGSNVSEALSFVNATSVNTADYTVTFPAITDALVSGDVAAGDGSTPASVNVSIPESAFTGGALSTPATFTLKFEDVADINDTLVVSISEIVAMATSNENITAPATLPYTVVAPVTIVPVAITIGEGTNQTVTLSLTDDVPTGEVIEIPYAFGGTATRGTDYTIAPMSPSTADDFIFNGGSRTASIEVMAIQDNVNEPDADETVTITIDGNNDRSVAYGTYTILANIVSTITIEDRAVDMEEVMMQVETVATVVATEHVSALTGLIRQRFSATSSFASPPRAPTGGIPAPSTDTNLALSDNPENMNDMINSMGLERSAQGDSNDHYAVWIRGQRSAFEGTPEVQGLTVNYDGTSTGVGVGAEYISSGYLMGLAMNFVTTEVDLSTEGGEGSESITKYEESIVIAAPYFSLKAGEGTSLWASVGVGTGTADAKLSGETKSADVSLSFLNAGADFTVIGRGFEVVTGLSGLIVRKVVDAFTFADTVIPKTTIDTMQGVGEITMYRPIPVAGQMVRPYLGISTIHDFGDIVADDDHGLGIRTGVAFGVGRISADIELSSELLRENRRQWTVSGGARFASMPGGKGLSLSLDGTQETQMDTEESVGDDAAQTWGIGLEGGYGMPAGLLHPNGLLTPFASIDQTGDGRDMSGGMRFSVGNGLSLDLETTRQMHDDSEDASEHKAGLRGQWSF